MKQVRVKLLCMQFSLFLTELKAVPTNAMTACRVSGERITLSLNLGRQWEMGGYLHAPVALLAGKEPLVPFEYEAGWAPELIWKFLRRDKSPTPTRIQTSDRLACSRVIVLSALSWLFLLFMWV